MMEKCRLIAGELADLKALNTTTATDAVSGFEGGNVTQLLITDHNAMIIYDSKKETPTIGKYVIFPEIVDALAGNDVFFSSYRDGAIRSTAAVPVYAYGTQIACVYVTEYDTEQGTLIASLQSSILAVTLTLEIIIILFSLAFSNRYSVRLRKIMSSIRTVRQGDYSHKLKMDGNDELKLMSDEFNDLISRLQTSESKRSQFVSDASHELKTPLASIKLLSDSILQNHTDPETTMEFVADIGREADRLNRMSQSLLTLSRIEGQTDREYNIIFITPTIEQVVRMLSGMARDSGVQIILELKEDCPILFFEDDLYQIIFNLVENGIKYNVKGGQVNISLHRQEDTVSICIRDTGVGIPKDSLNHIFERFYRVDKARSRSTGGSGLGLSIVRNMVERNHGSIRVDSEISFGTTFTLTFPIYDAKEGAQ